MGVPNESRIGRAIAFAIIVIALVVVGQTLWPDDPVEGQVGAQEDRIEAGSQPAIAPAVNQGAAGGQQAAAPG
jgi:hypothetical protein